MILLHRIDSYENMVLLRNFEQFARVEVWKPERSYAQSSSFYLIAKEVKVGHAVAVQVVEKWKGVWQTITFGGDGGTGTSPEEPSDERVVQALEVYGAHFVELGAPVWQIQARGLAKATYLLPREGRGHGRYEGEEGGWRLAPYGVGEKKKFPRYTGGWTWLSKLAKGEDREIGGALEEERPSAASLSS